MPFDRHASRRPTYLHCTVTLLFYMSVSHNISYGYKRVTRLFFARDTEFLYSSSDVIVIIIIIVTGHHKL